MDGRSESSPEVRRAAKATEKEVETEKAIKDKGLEDQGSRCDGRPRIIHNKCPEEGKKEGKRKKVKDREIGAHG